MDVSARREGVTAALALFAIAVVLVTAGGFVPSDLLPRVPDGAIAAVPHVNVAISLVAMATIVRGWRLIRGGNVERHRRAMSLAAVLFGLFLALYLYRLAVLGGPTGFEGSAMVYRYIYLPVLATHIFLAIVCIPLVFDALALGLTVPSVELPRTRHPHVGRLAASLWLISYTLGIVVYVMLHWA